MALATGLHYVINLAQEFSLLPSEIHRGLNLDFAEEVANRARSRDTYALTLQSKDPLRLTFRGNLELGTSTQGGDLDFTAEGRHSDADRHLAIQVITVTGEDGVLTDADLNIKVTTATGRAALPLAPEANLITVIHTGRHLDLKRLGFLNGSGSTAVATRRLNHRTAATAIGASLLN